MTVTFRPAKRENAPLLIGLAGGTGSGKTYSALRLARGIADNKPFAVIDTENGRANHYADYFPEMMHADLKPPFSPAAYLEAVKAADAEGFPVIVVDSTSHIWEGEGGVLDMQLDEVKRLGTGDNVKMLTWVEPKKKHRRFVNGLLQLRAHVILCFRAEDKIEMAKDDNGRTIVRPKVTLPGLGLDGWVPICEKRLPFEMTLSFLLKSEQPGVAKPIKLEKQHASFVPLDKPLDENVGRALAEWAAGGTIVQQPGTAASTLSAVVPGDLATEEQRRILVAAAEEHGLSGADARKVLTDVAGIPTLKQLRADKVDEVLEAIKAAGVQV